MFVIILLKDIKKRNLSKSQSINKVTSKINLFTQFSRSNFFCVCGVWVVKFNKMLSSAKLFPLNKPIQSSRINYIL